MGKQPALAVFILVTLETLGFTSGNLSGRIRLVYPGEQRLMYVSSWLVMINIQNGNGCIKICKNAFWLVVADYSR